MLRPDVVVAQLARLVLRVDDNLAHGLGEALEHTLTLRRRRPGAAPPGTR